MMDDYADSWARWREEPEATAVWRPRRPAPPEKTWEEETPFSEELEE